MWNRKAWDPTRPLTESKACTSVCAGGKAGEDLGLPPGDNGCGAGWIIDVYTLDCGSDWGWAFLLVFGLGTAGWVPLSLSLALWLSFCFPFSPFCVSPPPFVSRLSSLSSIVSVSSVPLDSILPAVVCVVYVPGSQCPA